MGGAGLWSGVLGVVGVELLTFNLSELMTILSDRYDGGRDGRCLVQVNAEALERQIVLKAG